MVSTFFGYCSAVGLLWMRSRKRPGPFLGWRPPTGKIMNFSPSFTCWLTHGARTTSKVPSGLSTSQVVIWLGACWCMTIWRKKRPSMQQQLSLMKASRPLVRELVRQTGLEEESLFMLSFETVVGGTVCCVYRSSWSRQTWWVGMVVSSSCRFLRIYLGWVAVVTSTAVFFVFQLPSSFLFFGHDSLQGFHCV